MGRKTEKAVDKITCDLCYDSLEKGQDVLKCEGQCGCTVHRYCAGVTKRHFETFDKGHSSRPFVCQWCFMNESRSIIEKLQSELGSLKSELAATKEALAEERAKTDHASPPASYASVAARPQNPQIAKKKSQRRGQHRGQAQCREAFSAEPGTSASHPSSTSTISMQTTRARVRVEGARKIWGTHPHATTKTIENAVQRYCNVTGLRIKRKTGKNVQTMKPSWWFVLHAEESVLLELEDKWDSLSMQTSWILKPCTKPQDVDENVPILPENSLNQQSGANVNAQQSSSTLTTDQSSSGSTVSDNQLSENHSAVRQADPESLSETINE